MEGHDECKNVMKNMIICITLERTIHYNNGNECINETLSIDLIKFMLMSGDQLMLSNSDNGLLAHIGHLLFTLYIGTYILSFGYAILGFFFFTSSTDVMSKSGAHCFLTFVDGLLFPEGLGSCSMCSPCS